MHGVRTADVDCESRDPARAAGVRSSRRRRTCRTKRATFSRTPPASSLGQPRVEFHTLQGGTDSPAKLYAALEPGLHRARRRAADRVYRSHHFALGLRPTTARSTAATSRSAGARTSCSRQEWNRLKIAGLLSFSLERLPDLARPRPHSSSQMTIDNSLSDGPDSVRTFFGVDIDLKQAFGNELARLGWSSRSRCAGASPVAAASAAQSCASCVEARFWEISPTFWNRRARATTPEREAL